ncbi:MAG: L-threonylcarbamoyladenylate synthase [Anaerolineae bacterium]|nr:L-threonylcarbamoyladenylate synthase [Anaerolineae bacterium]
MGTPIVSIRSTGALERAIACLQSGKLLVVPTDTIYGIAALPGQANIIDQLYTARGRAQEPALPFLLASAEEMAGLTRTNARALRLAQRFWPGPLTLILPPAANLPAEFRSYPIALRVPNFAPLIDLLKMVGGQLLATGAIRSGYPPAITAQEAADLLEGYVDLVLDGGLCPYGIPSTIVDCIADPPVIVRRGAISGTKIRQVLGLHSIASDRNL